MITALLPITDGGIDIKNNSLSDITWEVSGLNLVTSGEIGITSKMPYDITDVGIGISLADDNVKTIIVWDENNTISSNSTKELSLSGKTSIIDAILMIAYYNNDSDIDGISMPIFLEVQGYYLYSMIGIQANLNIDVNLSENGTLSYDSTDPNILMIQTQGVEDGDLISNLNNFYATVNNTDIQMSLTTSGNNISFEIATSNSEGLISELKESAAENEGTITITSYGEEYPLDTSETTSMIKLLDLIYGDV
ncbi:MAG: hypothetical protein M0P07_02320 [Candidatus Methanomethylophilaceae archaeon]|nr:hypothetical protein [Candidatus Methanomethylophilaceae archaeon]MDD3378533.1 hypothetical protein [Candidatus Methanomethylophilaceae archaeon]